MCNLTLECGKQRARVESRARGEGQLRANSGQAGGRNGVKVVEWENSGHTGTGSRAITGKQRDGVKVVAMGKQRARGHGVKGNEWQLKFNLQRARGGHGAGTGSKETNGN